MSAPVLTVDLGRIRDNIDTLRATVAPADVLLVLKNNAYGQGVTEVSAAASAHGVRWFGAIDVPTAIRIAQATDADARVFAWMTADATDLARAVEAGLELGVGDATYLEDVARAAAGRAVRVHLKIDTGLHRNGVRPEDWEAFVARAAALEAEGHIRVVGIWSHIAETSDADDDASREVFLWAIERAEAAGLRPEVRHLAASAAGFARESFRFDLVRFGAFVTGIRSAGGSDLPGIEPAATLRAQVSAVSDTGVTVDIGALDGLPSTLAGKVAVGTPSGARALLRVDDLTLTVASWPGAAVGDWVTVFGAGYDGDVTATSLAEAIDTVGEEIMVRLSPRIERVYLG